LQGWYLIIFSFFKDEMGKACSMHGENRNAYRVLVGTPEGNRPLEYLNVGGKISMDLRETGWGCMDRDRDLLNMVTNLWVP
jgi:hypothetical protein